MLNFIVLPTEAGMIHQMSNNQKITPKKMIMGKTLQIKNQESMVPKVDE